MDELDRSIIRALSNDARRPLSSIAEELDVAATTLHQRVRRLEEKGVIKGARLVVDWEAIGYPVVGIVSIEVGGRGLATTAQEVRALPQIESCYAVTGDWDLMAVARARSADHLGEVLESLRATLPVRSRTVVVLQTFFDGRLPPLDAEPAL